MTDPLDVAAVDVLGKRDLYGVALRSPYGLPPRNAAAPPLTPRPGTRPAEARSGAFSHGFLINGIAAVAGRRNGNRQARNEDQKRHIT